MAVGTGYLESLGFPDSHIFPDAATLQVLPWADKTARAALRAALSGWCLAMAAPRLVVKKLLGELDAVGLSCVERVRYEFYIVDAKTHDAPFPGNRQFRFFDAAQ